MFKLSFKGSLEKWPCGICWNFPTGLVWQILDNQLLLIFHHGIETAFIYLGQWSLIPFFLKMVEICNYAEFFKVCSLMWIVTFNYYALLCLCLWLWIKTRFFYLRDTYDVTMRYRVLDCVTSAWVVLGTTVPQIPSLYDSVSKYTRSLLMWDTEGRSEAITKILQFVVV